MICAVFGQNPQQFGAQISVFSNTNPSWVGYLTGTLNYNWLYPTTGSAQGAMLTTYTFASGSGITELIRNDQSNGANTVRKKTTLFFFSCFPFF